MKKNMKKTDETKEKKPKKNRQILVITLFFILLFVSMSVYIVKYAINNRQEFIKNSYNGRQKILIAKNIRGTIYDRNGDVLASSSVTPAGTEVRNYPYGNMFAHAVGYAVNGYMGVESMANYYLINSSAPISEKAKLDAQGKKYPGDSVVTTLDTNLQRAAYNALGAFNGAIIVTDPETGEILAMVSKPDFDPAQIRERWEELLNDKESGVLVNRATQGLYPPGSTFKLLTSLEYIREHPDDYDDYSFQCTGSFTRGEDTIRCYHGNVHGQVDFRRSLAVSCNSSYANIGLSLDRDKFGKLLDQLLFNGKLPTELTTSQSNLHVDHDTSDTDMMQISIGQGEVVMTPIQLNMITCAIANNGVLMKPYMISSVRNSNGITVKGFKPESAGELIPAKEAAIMRDMMEYVVSEGTSTRVQGDGYYAGGKTGSAEYGVIKGESHAWFTGYAGAITEEGTEEVPDVCVTVIIEEASSAAEYAVPVAKRMFEAYYGAGTE